MTGTQQGKKVATMNAEHQVFLDGQRTTTRCAFCSWWSFDGTAAQGRLEGEKHRRAEHPDLAPGGHLAEAFEARRRRRRPWTRAEVAAAFARFAAEQGREPTLDDVPLVPYLPSVNSVQKVIGSWSGAKSLAGGRLRAAQPPPAETTVDAPADPPAPENVSEEPMAAVPVPVGAKEFGRVPLARLIEDVARRLRADGPSRGLAAALVSASAAMQLLASDSA